MLVKKTRSEILNESLLSLVHTPITKTEPGAVARQLIEIMVDQLSDYYGIVEGNVKGSYIKSAVGNELDSIGALVGISRRNNEGDDNLRWRISKSVQTSATGNYASIKDAAEAVDGVEAVYLIPYTYGVGSFSIHVVGDSVVVSEATLDAVEAAIANVVPFGVYYRVVRPTYIDITIEMTITTKGAMIVDSIRASASSIVKEYINNTPVGGEILASDIENLVTALAPTDILHVEVNKIKTNQGTMRNTTLVLDSDERAVPSRFVNEPVSITVRS